MKIPSVNISPRVQCGKTAGKTRVSVTQFNPKLHCKDFVRMATPEVVDCGGPGGRQEGVEGEALHVVTLGPGGGELTVCSLGWLVREVKVLK